MLGLCVLPAGKLILGDMFALSQVNIVKFLLIVLILSLFYGALATFVATRIYNMSKIGNVWQRFVFPMWFLGCYQFSWQSLYQAFAPLAYLNFLNPLTYAMEGTRAAVLGQNGFLNYWLCLGMLIFFWLLFVRLGIAALKKRLDVV
jgi:ABC-type polysaccharide/polyol phosphate export permease